MKLHDLQECHLPKAEHEARQRAHLAQGELFEASVKSWNFDSNNNHWDVVAAKPVWSASVVPMAHMYKNMPFGAANTVELAGCVCFVSYYILMDYSPDYFSENDLELCLPFADWVKEVANKGYRAWRFRDYPGTFTSPKIDVQEVKARFADKVDLTCCDTKEDLIEKLGPAEGIGGSMFLIDNVISCLFQNKPVEDTRMTSVAGIFQSLQSGNYVPLRVNNAVYHNDPNRKGGHYVTLYGVQDGNALVWDSSIGEVELPFKTLMESAVKDKSLIAVWRIR